MSARIVLVTGAARGLGAAVARAFHQAGYRVGVSDMELAAATALTRQIDPDGDRVLPLALDVRDAKQFEAGLSRLTERWGRADVLVNNAVLTAAKPVLDITPAEFDSVLAVNLRGTFVGCQVFGRYFRDHGAGRIVNIASLAGQNGGTATGAHYAASKGGVMTLTKVFARDLAPFGVTVNAIAPGPLDLPSVRSLVPADRLGAIIDTIPAGRLGDPDFVARTAVLLAAPEAASVTGATWDINGGLLMR